MSRITRRASRAERVREDFVDADTIAAFVGRVEPGDGISLAVTLFSVAVSIALVLGATAWWMATH